MIKEEITPLQAMQYLAMLVVLDNSQIAKDTFDYFKHLVEENEDLKFKKELLEGMHDIDIKNNLYCRKVIEEQKEILDKFKKYIEIRTCICFNFEKNKYVCDAALIFINDKQRIEEADLGLFERWFKSND